MRKVSKASPLQRKEKNITNVSQLVNVNKRREKVHEFILYNKLLVYFSKESKIQSKV